MDTYIDAITGGCEGAPLKILVVAILPLATVVGGWYWRCNIVVDEKLDHGRLGIYT